MPFLSATRLHLRSKLYYLPFLLYTWRSGRQARKSPGFRGGALGGDADGGMWTVTAWDLEASMREFRSSGAHRAAMPKLLNWCDEASFTHWTVETADLPTMDEAYQRLRSGGKISKVNHPSAAHASGRTVSETRPRAGIFLRKSGSEAAGDGRG
jgi:hypothetical protein